MEKGAKELFSRQKIFFYIFSLAIFIFVAVYFTQIKKDIKLFEKVDPYWLVLAIMGQAGTYFFGAVVYQKLLTLFNIKVRVTIWKLFEASIITLFFNQTVPSAGISGNSFFFNFLRKRNVPVKDILPLIFIELLTFYAAMEFIIIFVILSALTFFRIPSFFYIVLAFGILVYFIFGLGISFLGRKRTISFIYRKIKSSKFVDKILSGVTRSFPGPVSFENMVSPFEFYGKNKTGTLVAVLLQLCIFLADSFTILALFMGLGVEVNILQVATAYILTKIISIIPFLPGALILFEGGMSLFFSRMTIDLGTAIIVTLLYRVLSFWLPILLGFFLYRRFQLKEK